MVRLLVTIMELVAHYLLAIVSGTMFVVFTMVLFVTNVSQIILVLSAWRTVMPMSNVMVEEFVQNLQRVNALIPMKLEDLLDQLVNHAPKAGMEASVVRLYHPTLYFLLTETVYWVLLELEQLIIVLLLLTVVHYWHHFRYQDLA